MPVCSRYTSNHDSCQPLVIVEEDHEGGLQNTLNLSHRPEAKNEAVQADMLVSMQPPLAASFRRAADCLFKSLDRRHDFASGRGQPRPSRAIPATVPFDPSANIHPSADIPHVAGHVMARAADAVLVRKPVVEIAQQFDLRLCDAHDDLVGLIGIVARLSRSIGYDGIELRPAAWAHVCELQLPQLFESCELSIIELAVIKHAIGGEQLLEKGDLDGRQLVPGERLSLQ